MIDFKTLQTKTRGELEGLLTEQRAHLAELRFKMSARELKNVHEVKNTRRTIARMLTLLTAQKAAAKTSAAVRA
mgnify:CR=1 FL=1